ncbi:hypothetical protein N8642_00705 [bacterium]|nr:hypothetical protein [bacterium]
MQADSHLDFGIVPEKYDQTFTNVLEHGTDFHIELGDTFMVDKYTDYRQADSQYLAQRYYFSRLCHSAPSSLYSAITTVSLATATTVIATTW